jgi:hypothetical protein
MARPVGPRMSAGAARHYRAGDHIGHGKVGQNSILQQCEAEKNEDCAPRVRGSKMRTNYPACDGSLSETRRPLLKRKITGKIDQRPSSSKHHRGKRTVLYNGGIATADKLRPAGIGGLLSQRESYNIYLLKATITNGQNLGASVIP